MIFGDVPSLLDDLKATFDKKSESSFEQLMNDLTRADMLILDDIGAEYSTDWAVERLYTVINNRYNAGRPILSTSNYGKDELKRHFKGNMTGSRIVSRLVEMGEMILIGGKDRRYKNEHRS